VHLVGSTEQVLHEGSQSPHWKSFKGTLMSLGQAYRQFCW